MDSAAIGFLRSTAERAGSLALAAPRSASTHLARWIMKAADSIASRTEAATATTTTTTTTTTPAPSLPSPVTYLTSAYLVTSLALAFLLHRIHHLVPPRLHPAPGAIHHQHQRVMQPLVQVGCRVPGIALLASAVIALLAQILNPNADANHPALLWQCYLAVCATVTGETFVRALSDDLPHAHHQFNLLSFSFLLHVHSASSTTTTTAAGSHSELYTYLLITLGEILALQITYCAPHLPLVNKLDQAYRSRFAPLSPGVNRSASMRRIYRLPITALCSLTAQYFALRSWSRVFSSPRSAADHNNSNNVVGEAEEFGTVWLNKVPELVLEFIVGTSVALKTLAAVIRGEELSMENLVGPAALTPRPEDDYAVALIKYATHLLSMTRLSGLAHELSPLEILPSSVSSSLETLGFLEPPPCDSEDCPVHGAENRMAAREADELVRNGGRGQEVVLQRNGDVVFWDLIPLDGHGNPVAVGSSSEGALAYTPPPPAPPGFTNEIRRVSVESPFGAQVDADGSYAADGSWTGNPGGAVPSFSPFSRRMAHVEGERKSALWRLVGLCCRIAVYVVWRGWSAVRWAVRGVAARVLGGSRREEWELERRWRSEEGREVREARETRDGDARTTTTTTTTRRTQSMTPNAEAWASGASSSAREGIGADEEDDGGEWLPDSVVDGVEDGEWEDDEDEEEDGDDMPDVETQIEDEDVDEDDLGGTNPLVLYSDLVSQPARHPQQQQSSPPASEAGEDLAPYLLAHHLAPSRAGPLTRRRYRALLLPPSPSPSPSSSSSQTQQQTTTGSNGGGMAALSSAIDHRRAQVIEMARRQGQGGGGGGEVDVARWMEEEREKWREGKSRFCVVCTVEERTVVLWPCRCLCLCEACRAALAERTTSAVFDDGAGAAGGSGAGGQLCPTCRTPVQGFSRIFTP